MNTCEGGKEENISQCLTETQAYPELSTKIWHLGMSSICSTKRFLHNCAIIYVIKKHARIPKKLTVD